MISSNKTLIPGKRNANGSLIYIPEKFKIKGVLYVRPYTIQRISVTQNKLIIAEKQKIPISIKIKGTETTITTPFSRNMILSYERKSLRASRNNAGRYVIIPAAQIKNDIKMDKKTEERYNRYKTGNTEQDQIVIYYIGAAVPMSWKEYQEWLKLQ